MGFRSPFPFALLKKPGNPIRTCVCARPRNAPSIRVLCWNSWRRGSPIHHRPLEMERTRKRPGKNLIQLYHFTNEKNQSQGEWPAESHMLIRNQKQTRTSWLQLPLHASAWLPNNIREPYNYKNLQPMASPYTLFKMKQHSTYFQRSQHKPVSRPTEEFSVVLRHRDSRDSKRILCNHG